MRATGYPLKNDEILGLLNEDMLFFDVASGLCVPPELLDFKFRILKRKEYKVIDPPWMVSRDFLKNRQTT